MIHMELPLQPEKNGGEVKKSVFIKTKRKQADTLKKAKHLSCAHFSSISKSTALDE